MKRRAFAAFGAAAIIASRASADTFPNKPLRLVVPFTPGGTTDILAREIAAKLTAALGQSCVVENKPGGGGTVGCELVARAEPDGYTMLMGHIGTLAINPLVYPRHSYDPVKGWTAISYVANVPNVLAVNAANVPARSVPELVALAKAQPGALAYGTGGTGSASHLASAYFAFATGTDFLHVPYKGTAPFVNDLVAGRLQMGFTGAPVVMPLSKQGSLRPLGISSAPSAPTPFPNSRPSRRAAIPASRPTSGTASPALPASIPLLRPGSTPRSTRPWPRPTSRRDWKRKAAPRCSSRPTR